MQFLKFADEAVLELALGIFLVLYVLSEVFFKKRIKKASIASGGLMGAVAGFFGASFNINGPIVGLYSVSDDSLSKDQIKDKVATYLFLQVFLF